MGKKDRTSDKKYVGGLPFFLSLICLLLLSIANLITLPELFDHTALIRWGWFIGGLTLGIGLASTLLTGRTSVFLHELKHSILSNLAGNRAHGMTYKSRSGEFRYAYTSATKHFNALIALAPYFVPLFTVMALLTMLVPQWRTDTIIPLLVIGMGYGADCVLNCRDISPVQTDITQIAGGYHIGLLFIIAMNITIMTIIAAWVSQDWYGVGYLLYNLQGVSEWLIKFVAG